MSGSGGVTQLYSDHAAKAAELVRGFAVPLFRQRTPTVPEFEGTGLLLKVDAEHRFLVTAAHVLDALGNRVFLLCSGREEYALDGAPTLTSLPPSGNRDDDSIDLGYVRLTEEEAASVGEDHFLDIRWLGVRDAAIPTRGTYFVLGYPHGRQRQDFAGRAYHVSQTYYWAPEAKAAIYKHARLERAAHVLLSYDPNRVNGPKGVGGSPSFRGMSGAGIWRFDAAESYRPDNPPRLVGIHLGRAKGVKELMGSRVSLLLAMWRREYPHLDRKLPTDPGLIVNTTRDESSAEDSAPDVGTGRGDQVGE